MTTKPAPNTVPQVTAARVTAPGPNPWDITPPPTTIRRRP
jgi:hypothetical protein